LTEGEDRKGLKAEISSPKDGLAREGANEKHKK